MRWLAILAPVTATALLVAAKNPAPVKRESTAPMAKRRADGGTASRLSKVLRVQNA